MHVECDSLMRDREREEMEGGVGYGVTEGLGEVTWSETGRGELRGE